MSPEHLKKMTIRETLIKLRKVAVIFILITIIQETKILKIMKKIRLKWSFT